MVHTNELLNWVSRRTDSSAIEVFVAKKLNSGMVFPMGKLSSDNLDGAKILVEKYSQDIVERHFWQSDMPEEMEIIPEIVFEWWRSLEEGEVWYLRCHYEYLHGVITHNKIARIETLENANIDLEGLRQNLEEGKLFKGGMT